MNKKTILATTFVLAIAFLGCNKTQKETQNSENKIAVNDSITTEHRKNTSTEILAKPEVPVLCYHRIADGRKDAYSVSPATFEAHMKVLADSGYHSILPDQLYDYLVFNKTLPTKPFLLSFDDSREEHFSIAAPVMEKYGFKGAFFIMTITYNKKNYMNTDQIAQLKKSGHCVGLHSWDHTMVTKYKDSTDWNKQVVEPKRKLENIIGSKVEYWAYPNGVYNHQAALELDKYCKISFILFSKRDSVYPLQSVRRIIVPECSQQGLLKSMRRTFKAL